MEAKPTHSNRLIHETSPYLLQHAHNPVDWYPWGEEAFEKAKRENKPILLSIGYSACHWCHVMEHESFENEKIAALMNQLFVSVKVDREERPDLDEIYMNAVQMLTGHGGWPMSVFLTPDLKPFYGGTYWPPRGSRGMPGFDQILAAVIDAWKNRREQALDKDRLNRINFGVYEMGSVFKVFTIAGVLDLDPVRVLHFAPATGERRIELAESVYLAHAATVLTAPSLMVLRYSIASIRPCSSRQGS